MQPIPSKHNAIPQLKLTFWINISNHIFELYLHLSYACAWLGLALFMYTNVVYIAHRRVVLLQSKWYSVFEAYFVIAFPKSLSLALPVSLDFRCMPSIYMCRCHACQKPHKSLCIYELIIGNKVNCLLNRIDFSGEAECNFPTGTEWLK